MKKNYLTLSFPINWIKNRLGDLPRHLSLSYFWNFGSFLGIILSFQLVTGLLLSINFIRDGSIAFQSVIILSRDSFFGFILRWTHLNGGSLFFFNLFSYISRFFL